MRYLVKVETWSRVEVEIVVEASTDREARERALLAKTDPKNAARGFITKKQDHDPSEGERVDGQAARGFITKNKTTILRKESA